MQRFVRELALRDPELADAMQQLAVSGISDLDAFNDFQERMTRAVSGNEDDLQRIMHEERAHKTAQADYYPSNDEVKRVHMQALAQCERDGHLMRALGDTQSDNGPLDSINVDTGEAAASASAVGGRSRTLHMIKLSGLRTSEAPLYGAVVGGVIDARSYRYHPTQGAVTTLLRSDDGALTRLVLYNLPREVERGLSPGRRIVIEDVWLKRLRDGFLGVRVDDPNTLHFDTSAEEAMVAAVSTLVDADVMAVASAAKEEGSRAFRSSKFSVAIEAYSRGLSALLQSGDIPLVDFGLSTEPLAPPLLTIEGPEAVDLATILLNNRAAAALKIGRTCRALMDTQVALGLTPTLLKTTYRRAQALLSIGACVTAVEVLAPHAKEGEHKRLSTEATERAASAAVRTWAALAKSSRSSSTHAQLAYIGPIHLQRLGGRKGRGWVASSDITAGQLLLVEPSAALSSLGKKEKEIESDLLLFKEVCKTLGSGNEEADALREKMSCMHPLAGAVQDSGTRFRDDVMAPLVQMIASKFGMPRRDALLFERKVQRNQFGLGSRLCGELFSDGEGLFPLCSSFNHSCHPSAGWQPLDGALVVVAMRSIAAGEEVCISYHDRSEPGFKRSQKLLDSHGFVCTCERCTAPPGSALFEAERARFGLICPCGSAESGHLLCPTNPYDSFSAYCCLAIGCGEALDPQTAHARVKRVGDSFEALRLPFRRGEFPAGCRMAEAAAERAHKVIGPLHHEWRMWASASHGLSTRADVVPLIIKSAATAEEACAGIITDDIVFMRFNAALLFLMSGHGILPPLAAQQLRLAFEGHKQMSGNSDVDVFLRLWVPPEFHRICCLELTKESSA